MDFFLLAIFMVIGLFAGFLSGLTGLGGGAIVVPALIEVFRHWGIAVSHEAQVAVGTSVVIVAVNNFLTAQRYFKISAIDWHFVRVMAPFMMMGGALGPKLSTLISSQQLSLFFSLFMIVISFHIFLSKQKVIKNIKPFYILCPAAFAFGLLSGVMGVSGAVLLIPFLMRQGLLMREAVATSATVTLPVMVVASAMYMWVGGHLVDLPVGSVGYVFFPAAVVVALTGLVGVPFGVYLATRLHNDHLRNIFAGILLVWGARLLWLNI